MSIPYAPITTRTPSHSRVQNSNLNLDLEVSLYSTPQQRETQESLAELFSIITALDLVERSYVKDTVRAEEYTSTVLRLLAQYSTLLKNSAVQEQFGSLQQFSNKYSLHCPHATNRIEVGVPATVEHATTASSSSSKSARAVAEATGNFITAMDALKLSYRAKDQLHPLLSDLMASVNKVTPQDFQGRARLVEWLIKINKMRVTEELSEDDSRQLLFDLDSAYKGFYTVLE